MKHLRNVMNSGVVISWHRWQVSLALLGSVIYIGVTDWDLNSEASGRDCPFAQVSRDDHDAPVWSLTFSGSRRLASSTSSDLRVKDLATGKVVRLLDFPDSFGLRPAFSPDGRVLAIGGHGPEIRLWDAETLLELEPLTLGTKAARSVAFSPDSATLAVATWTSHEVTLWDCHSRRPIDVLDVLDGNVKVVAFSPDGSTLISADSTSNVYVWELASRRVRARWRAHPAGISAMAFSPDGRLIATASYLDNAVRLWDSRGGESKGLLAEDFTGVTGLAFSPDATTLVLSRADGVASLWDLASRRQIGEVKIFTGSLQSVEFAADGRVFATGGFDGAVRYWDVAQVIGAEPHEPFTKSKFGGTL
jgi:WD40 repeat protein